MIGQVLSFRLWALGSLNNPKTDVNLNSSDFSRYPHWLTIVEIGKTIDIPGTRFKTAKINLCATYH